MISVPIVTMISFLVILSDLKWKWVETEDKKPIYAHSIVGIITLAFSFVQVN